jgi:hypothetical protein
MEGIGMDDQRANAADWRAGKPHDRAWNSIHGLSCRLLIILFLPQIIPPVLSAQQKSKLPAL